MTLPTRPHAPSQAHLQGTQSRHTEANLAKVLHLPTHGKQSFNSGRQKTTKKKKKPA